MQITSIHEISIYEDPQTLEEICRLRVHAWRARTDRFPVGLRAWSDEFDATSTHFAVRVSDRVVAAARLSIATQPTKGPDGAVYSAVEAGTASPPVAFFSRLVVCHEHAGRGFPRMLDAARLSRAKEAGCRSILANTDAGERRIRQLEGYGFHRLYTAVAGAAGPLQEFSTPTVLGMSIA